MLIVIGWRIDFVAYAEDFQAAVMVWAQKRLDVPAGGLGGVQPGRLVIGIQDDRHAIMDLGHLFVRLGGDDRVGLPLLAFGVGPAATDAGTRDYTGLLRMYIKGLLARFGLGRLLPFVKSGGGYQGALFQHH